MTDLTKIEKPFGLLDAETQEALKAHGGPYEYFGSGEWRAFAAPTPVFDLWFTYRVKPQPPKPREFWLLDGRVYESPINADCANFGRAEEVIHVREVLDE